MSVTSKYYTSVNFLNNIYAVDLQAIDHFAELFFNGDASRVIYASNAYAFRKRADQNEGNLELPFINFYLNGYDPGIRERWHVGAYSSGMFIDEIGEKVQFAPITLSYEASYWCHTDYDVKYAFSEFVWDTDNKTILKPSVSIKGEDIAFPAHLSYSGLDINPTYNEQDWLERNKIHSASIDFDFETLALKSNSNVVVTETALLKFAADQNLPTEDIDEIYEVLVETLN